MLVNKLLLCELVGNLGVVFIAAGVLDGLWRQSNFLEGSILVSAGVVLVALSTLKFKRSDQ